MFSRPLGAATLALAALDVNAQRADDNALSSAEDAFGTTIGNETIGLYSTSQVRGFSPVDAGNIRIEGLYIDRRGSVSPLLIDSSVIRIGLSAQSYPFPAPTGIVDYRLRKAGDAPVASIVSGVGAYGAPSLEIDASAPVIADQLSLAVGFSYAKEEYYDGADANYMRASFTPHWKINDDIEVTAFANLVRGRDEEVAPVIVTAGPWLPPEVDRRRYFGQQWADNETENTDYGTLLKARLNSDWSLSAGLFRSSSATPTGFSEIFSDTTRDGITRELVIADPAQKFLSSSGEIKLTGNFIEGQRLHRFHFMVRGRDQHTRYGGSAPILDLGLGQLGQARPVAEPDSFDFTEQAYDTIAQWTAGIGYEARWAHIGEFSIGAQQSDYKKSIAQPALPLTTSYDTPRLFNASAAAYLTNTFAIFISQTEGLEESGIAPDYAVNRNQALEAIHTTQSDAGIRWNMLPELKLVATAFTVKKPYFTTNNENLYTTIGKVNHQGVELSASGTLTEQWKIVAGAVLMNPRVSGEAVNESGVGQRPVGQVKRLVKANIEYSPRSISTLSFDMALTHYGDRVASNDGLLAVPAYTLMDLGLRYRFTIGESASLLRLRVGNVTDVFSWKVYSSNSFGLMDERNFSAFLTVDLP